MAPGRKSFPVWNVMNDAMHNHANSAALEIVGSCFRARTGENILPIAMRTKINWMTGTAKEFARRKTCQPSGWLVISSGSNTIQTGSNPMIAAPTNMLLCDTSAGRNSEDCATSEWVTLLNEISVSVLAPSRCRCNCATPDDLHGLTLNRIGFS